MSEPSPTETPAPLSAAMLAARPFLGKKVEHGGKTWRVASIRAGHPDRPWAWMVNTKKPMEQVRLSMQAECFQ